MIANKSVYRAPVGQRNGTAARHQNRLLHYVDHVVVDDRSNDGTLEILEKASASGSPRFVSESDNGIYDSMNKGLALVDGDVVGLRNSDDIYASPRVLEMIEWVFSDASVDACCGDLVFVDRNDTVKVKRCWRSGSSTGTPFHERLDAAVPDFLRS